jgi:molybdopterin molybdotransferase
MDGAHISTGCGCDSLAQSQDLLTHDQAIGLAVAQVQPIIGCETLPLAVALGRITAQAIFAPHAMPYFDNSAMDGFAIRHADMAGRCCLPVAGTVAAGDPPGILPQGAALRIYTGAPLPQGSDTVVMVESCIDKSHKVHIANLPKLGANIRRHGSDQAKGTILLPAGTKIAPHHIGLLAANGIEGLTVNRRPRVAVFSTGDEVTTGPCTPGQIPDANRPLLCALLAAQGAEVVDMGILPDDLALSTDAFRAMSDQFDLIVTSGAVSMGGKDHMQAALIAAGGTVGGWRVAIKPGKPVLFGKLGHAGFTGLAGNPFAVHVGFHLFVTPQLARMSGTKAPAFAPFPAVAGFAWRRHAGRAEVFAVRLSGHDDSGRPVLQRLGAGVSATLLPLAGADGLAIVSAQTATVKPGDMLHWHPFCGQGGTP